MEEQILEKNKTFIKTRLKDILHNYTNADVNKTFIKNELKDILYNYTSADVKKEIPNQNYISSMFRTYETEIIQKLFNDYDYDLVVESMVELFLTEAEENE